MEYVVVQFDEDRDVFVDDQKNGKTNTTLRLGAGTHTFSLGDPQDYSPQQITKVIQGSSVLQPETVTFTRNA